MQYNSIILPLGNFNVLSNASVLNRNKNSMKAIKRNLLCQHEHHETIFPLQLHADLSVYFRNGHNRWILYPEGSIYSSGLSLRECSF